jgi:hypothetical protein
MGNSRFTHAAELLQVAKTPPGRDSRKGEKKPAAGAGAATLIRIDEDQQVWLTQAGRKL